MTALERAIESVGSAKALAAALNLKHSMNITHWKKRGLIPSKWVIPIFNATGVTPHELRPDLHPNPTDGLPAEQHNTTKEN